jgi:hypothetical protein
MAGKVTSLDGETFDARVTGAGGAQLLLHAELQIDNQAGTVNGSLVATRA